MVVKLDLVKQQEGFLGIFIIPSYFNRVIDYNLSNCQRNKTRLRRFWPN